MRATFLAAVLAMGIAAPSQSAVSLLPKSPSGCTLDSLLESRPQGRLTLIIHFAGADVCTSRAAEMETTLWIAEVTVEKSQPRIRLKPVSSRRVSIDLRRHDDALEFSPAGREFFFRVTLYDRAGGVVASTSAFVLPAPAYSIERNHPLIERTPAAVHPMSFRHEKP